MLIRSPTQLPAKKLCIICMYACFKLNWLRKEGFHRGAFVFFFFRPAGMKGDRLGRHLLLLQENPAFVSFRPHRRLRYPLIFFPPHSKSGLKTLFDFSPLKRFAGDTFPTKPPGRADIG